MVVGAFRVIPPELWGRLRFTGLKSSMSISGQHPKSLPGWNATVGVKLLSYVHVPISGPAATPLSGERLRFVPRGAGWESRFGVIAEAVIGSVR